VIGQIAYVSITAGLSYTFAVRALKRRERITLAIEQDAAPAFRDLLIEGGLLFASGLFGLLAAFYLAICVSRYWVNY
jgi:hypothetical protein